MPLPDVFRFKAGSEILYCEDYAIIVADKTYVGLLNLCMFLNVPEGFLCHPEQHNRNIPRNGWRNILLFVMNDNPRPPGEVRALRLNRTPQSEIVNDRGMQLTGNIMNIHRKFDDLISDVF